jgi:hypothetical protein
VSESSFRFARTTSKMGLEADKTPLNGTTQVAGIVDAIGTHFGCGCRTGQLVMCSDDRFVKTMVHYYDT